MSPTSRFSRQRHQRMVAVAWVMIIAIGLSVIASVLAITLH
jgi:uncharacterized Rmd1/YagE family protein